MSVNAEGMRPSGIGGVLDKLKSAIGPGVDAPLSNEPTWSKQNFRMGMRQLRRDTRNTRTSLTLNEDNKLAYVTKNALGNVTRDEVLNPPRVIDTGASTPLDVKGYWEKSKRKVQVGLVGVALAGMAAMQTGGGITQQEIRQAIVEPQGIHQTVDQYHTSAHEDPQLPGILKKIEQVVKPKPEKVLPKTINPNEVFKPEDVMHLNVKDYISDKPAVIGGVELKKDVSYGSMTLPDGSVFPLRIVRSMESDPEKLTPVFDDKYAEMTLVVAADGHPVGFVHSGSYKGKKQLGEYFVTSFEGTKGGILGPDQIKANTESYVKNGKPLVLEIEGKKIVLKPTEVDYLPPDSSGEKIIDALYDTGKPEEFELSFCGRGGPEAIKKYGQELASSKDVSIQNALKMIHDPEAVDSTVETAFMVLYKKEKEVNPKKAALMLLEFTAAEENADGSLKYLKPTEAEQKYKELTGDPNATFEYWHDSRYTVAFKAQNQ